MVGPQVISRILASPDFEAFGSARPRGQNSAAPRMAAPRRRQDRARIQPARRRARLARRRHGAGRPGIARPDLLSASRQRRPPLGGLECARQRQQPGADLAQLRVQPQFHQRGRLAVERRRSNGLQSPAALGYRYDDEEGPFAADVDFPAPVGRRRSIRSAARCRPTGGLPATRCRARPALQRYRAGVRRRRSTPRRRTTTGRRRTSARSAFRFRSAGRSPRSSSPGRWRRLRAADRRRDRQCIWAVLRDCEAPTDPSTRVRVFVNREGVDRGARSRDPHYVTTMSFFGAGHGDHHAQHGGHGSHQRAARAGGARRSRSISRRRSRGCAAPGTCAPTRSRSSSCRSAAAPTRQPAWCGRGGWKSQFFSRGGHAMIAFIKQALKSRLLRCTVNAVAAFSITVGGPVDALARRSPADRDRERAGAHPRFRPAGGRPRHGDARSRGQRVPQAGVRQHRRRGAAQEPGGGAVEVGRFTSCRRSRSPRRIPARSSVTGSM